MILSKTQLDYIYNSECNDQFVLSIECFWSLCTKINN